MKKTSQILLKSRLPLSQRQMSTLSPSYFIPYNLSIMQRAFLIPYFGLGAITDPRRGDLVAGLGDATGEPQLQKIKASLLLTAAGRKLMIEKPLITKQSLKSVSVEPFPEKSLGHKYTEFMKHHDFSADERTVVRFISDPDTAYVMCRYRQVHDFWHVLCDLPPTVLGEIALKFFELKATGLPVCLFSSLLGPLKLSSEEKKFLILEYSPWVARSKSRCDEILSYRYEDNLYKSISDIREELGIEIAPKMK
mmetsp:Transcript_35856/g.33957  ORF Transcript_35856/g.33957 Transcript_35856/m.33957 type:complete len:251 (-) Transcript_35856:49-801(-)